MPSLQDYKAHLSRSGNMIGQVHKNNSDMIMEHTWSRDIQAKKCYIYDYFHDDFFIDDFGNKRALKDGMTYENTSKTPIDAKFIIKSYQTMDSDEVAHYVQFRPSQKIRFDVGDDLYYYEGDYRKRFSSEFPIGLYIDVPDSNGVYHKWLICRKETANQFPKYLVLPVDYELMWVEQNGADRIKRRMWAVLRNQQSYTSGVYRDRYFAHTDNQNKIWLPMNSITESIWYTENNEENMRFIVSALTKHPSVWRVSKVENTTPFGLQKITIYSDFFNEHTDYVNLESGEMYADYFSSNTAPSVEETDNGISGEPIVTLEASSSTIKVGGSYKTLTATILDNLGNDISSDYSKESFRWHCAIADVDYSDFVVWKDGAFDNQIKVKLPNDVELLGQVINITCWLTTSTGAIVSETLQLEIG